MTTKVYDPTEISVVWGAIEVDSGLNNGVFVSIEWLSEMFKSVAGLDGEVTRVKTGDGRAKVMITLHQTSDGNARFSAVHALDILTPGGAGIAPMTIRDRQGTSLHFAENAWIVKPPKVEYSNEVTTREWEFECDFMSGIIGGN
jgi:hypothetical protein